MGMPAIPSVLPVPRVRDAFDDEAGRRTRNEIGVRTGFLSELVWFGEALWAARNKDGKDKSPDRTSCEALEVGPSPLGFQYRERRCSMPGARAERHASSVSGENSESYSPAVLTRQSSQIP
jgi:hypothetical protein